jgi:tight adherence protein B
VLTRWRRGPAVADDVAPTLDELARAVSSGATLSAAIGALAADESVRPFARRLAIAHRQHELGVALADALDRPGPPHSRRRRARTAAAAADLPEVALGLAVIGVAARHGGRTAANLDRAAAAVRERRAVVGERRAQSAQARLSALVLSVLPLGFGAWSATTDPRILAFLLGTTLGWLCLGVGLALNAAGWWWMRRIVGATR